MRRVGPAVVGTSLLGTAGFGFNGSEEMFVNRLSAFGASFRLRARNGQARAMWQHSIPDTKATRYSITLRTLKRK